MPREEPPRIGVVDSYIYGDFIWAMDLSSLVEKASRSVVGVVTKLSDVWGLEEGRSFGTAFSAGGGLFLTAFHVVAGADAVLLVTPEGETAEARPIAGDPNDDLALLASDLSARRYPSARLEAEGRRARPRPGLPPGHARQANRYFRHSERRGAEPERGG
jgi:Trypsin-like serine proteases, typically periplasmic, contain C-terminal PDZ domain